jgi:hypothetical protein
MPEEPKNVRDAGILAWCALALAVWATRAQRSLTPVPMLAMAATFEISFFIHRAIERVGRYMQVRFWVGDSSAHGDWLPASVRSTSNDSPG